jgi:hypothetical protein
MAKKSEKPKRRGRPALDPSEGKRHPLNMRTTKELRAKLEAAAKESGRSMAQEVEARLEASFAEERYQDLFGGPANYRLATIFGSIASSIDYLNSKEGKPLVAEDWDMLCVAVARWGFALAPFYGEDNPIKGLELANALGLVPTSEVEMEAAMRKFEDAKDTPD